MQYSCLKELAENERKNIEMYKNEILRLKNEMSKISDKKEINSYLNSINFLEYIISEKEKLINSINSGNIYNSEIE